MAGRRLFCLFCVEGRIAVLLIVTKLMVYQVFLIVGLEIRYIKGVCISAVLPGCGRPDRSDSCDTLAAPLSDFNRLFHCLSNRYLLQALMIFGPFARFVDAIQS